MTGDAYLANTHGRRTALYSSLPAKEIAMEDTATATAALLAQLAKLVKGMKDDDVRSILAGETKIVLVPNGSKVVTPLVLGDIAEQVRRLSDQAQVISLLDADKRLSGPVLKQLADELNITVPGNVKAKPAIQLYIAQTLTEHRHRNYGV
jgi:hypothetical protein